MEPPDCSSLIAAGAGDCSRGDLRVGAGEGVRDLARPEAFRLPSDAPGGASSASDGGVPCRHGGGGGIDGFCVGGGVSWREDWWQGG